jgi:hypothetical protein
MAVTIQYYTRRGTVPRQLTLPTDEPAEEVVAALIELHLEIKRSGRLDYIREITLAPPSSPAAP